MRWVFTVVLLLSLGLNVGLSWRQWSPRKVERPLPTSGFALDDSNAWHERVDRRFGRMSDILGLDTDQREAFREIHRTGGHDMRRRFMGITAGRRELAALFAQPDLSPERVRVALAGIARRQAAMDSASVAKVVQELEILTPAQREVYLRMLPMDRLGGQGGRGGGHLRGRPGSGPARRPHRRPPAGDNPG